MSERYMDILKDIIDVYLSDWNTGIMSAQRGFQKLRIIWKLSEGIMIWHSRTAKW